MELHLAAGLREIRNTYDFAGLQLALLQVRLIATPTIIRTCSGPFGFGGYQYGWRWSPGNFVAAAGGCGGEGDVTRNLVPRQIGSGRTEIGSQNRSFLLISVRPGALELNKNLNYRGLVDSNPVVDIDTDKDVLWSRFTLGPKLCSSRRVTHRVASPYY